MGGIGSGRYWHYNAKSTVNDYHSIDIRKWHYQNLLTLGTSFRTKWFHNEEPIASINVIAAEKSLILSYRYKRLGEWKDMDYPVNLEWTSCRFGGERPWFLCPVKNCGHRVAILYGGVVFACRLCHQLAYPSQREHYGDRAGRSAEKIREQLKWEPGILNGEELKPKGMHWKTFERLCKRHSRLVRLCLQEAEMRFGENFNYLMG